MNYNLSTPFYDHAVEHPDDLALVIEKEEFSYQTLWTLAGRIARRLHERIQNNPRVVILSSRNIEAYAGILGVCSAGGTYVALNPKWPGQRIESVLTALKPCAIIADEKAIETHRATLANWEGIILEDPLKKKADNQDNPSPFVPVEVGPGHDAYIMFTSGSTGVPKGVVLSTEAVSRFLDSIKNIYSVCRSDRLPHYSELSFDFSVFDLFVTWAGGASLWVVPESQLIGPGDFIEASGLTFWVSVPTAVKFMERLKQARAGRFTSIRASVFCGEPLTVEAALLWQAACPGSVVDNHYGPTEAAVMCGYYRVSEPVQITPGRGIISIGRPYPGTELAVVDSKLGFVADGTTGELAIAGKQLATAYFENPQLTKERFVFLQHPKLGYARWYLTGDLAFCDNRGNFHHLGRNDRQVKVLGYRVELDEVEAHLRKAYNTQAVAAVAWPTIAGTASGIVAFVESAEDTENPSGLGDSLPKYMRPKRIVRMKSLPISLNRKIDRQALIKYLEEEDKCLRHKKPRAA